jgi:hypothetical protein
MQTATIISFCTTEARFLKACIEQCRKFSSQIIIPICDHLFDGTPENKELIERIILAFPDCMFLLYPYAQDVVPKRYHKKFSHFMHSAARVLGTRFLHHAIEGVFFVDADEIPDGARVVEWMETKDCAQLSGAKFSCYWYFRESKYQATTWENAILFVKHNRSISYVLHERERDAFYDQLPEPKKQNVVGLDGTPLVHHFSWVRTKEEMLRKVESWGHRDDCDWRAKVELEFAGSFKGTDFVHGYSYRECNLPFEISLGEIEFEPKESSSRTIIRLSPQEWINYLQLPELKGWKKYFSCLNFACK